MIVNFKYFHEKTHADFDEYNIITYLINKFNKDYNKLVSKYIIY